MAIEAALVVPLLTSLVFGMLEMSFAVRDYASVASLSRAGVRVAATGAAAGPADKVNCGTGTAQAPCAPANVPALAQLAADAVQRSGFAIPPDQIVYMIVYKANVAGYPGAEGVKTMPTGGCDAVSNCVKFTWDEARDGFRYASDGRTWTSTTISACFPGSTDTPLDRVGV